MHKETGEIRKYEDVPKNELGKWSEAFREGEVVDFKGVNMKIIRIKKLKKEIHLRFEGN